MRGRPIVREVGGRWSLQQVYLEAGITLSVARTVVRRGMLDPDALTEDDVVVLRVAAALLEAPRPEGARTQTAEVVAARDEAALLLAREAVSRASVDPAAVLLVSPDQATLAADMLGVMNALAARRGETLLMLPIGDWITALPSRRRADLRAAG